MGKVFRPWRKHTTFLGVRGKYWIRIFAVLAVGVAVFFALGTLTISTEQPYSTAERHAMLSELESLKNVVAKRDALAARVGTEDLDMLDLTADEKAMLEEAASLGITASSTREQLQALVPTTKTVEAERFGSIPRFALCVAIPTVLAFAWHLDMKGRALCSEASRIRRFKKRQRFYLMGPRRPTEEES